MASYNRSMRKSLDAALTMTGTIGSQFHQQLATCKGCGKPPGAVSDHLELGYCWPCYLRFVEKR